MLRAARLLVWILTGLLAGLFLHADSLAPQTTPRKPVRDTYHGVTVEDPYRWLEDADDPEVQQWVREQHRRSEAYLARLPARPASQRRLRQLNRTSTHYYTEADCRSGVLFALANGSLESFTNLDRLTGGRLLADPDDIVRGGSGAIDFFVPSPDGRLVAVSISEGGKQEGSVHVFEAASGRKRADVLPRVHTAMGGSLAWAADSSGFYYTRYPSTMGRPVVDAYCDQRVYFHKLGTSPQEDVYVFGNDQPRTATLNLEVSEDGKYLLVTAETGWASDQVAHYLRDPSGKWTTLAGHADHVTGATFGRGEDLYLLSWRNAPRGQILRLSRKDPRLDQAKVVVPEGKGVVFSFVLTPSWLYLVERLDGNVRLRLLDHAGREQKAVPVPPASTIEELVSLRGDEVLFRTESYLTPSTWYRYNPETGVRESTPLSWKSAADFGDCEVVRETATSKDGTRVPLTILRRKGTVLDGQRPVLLTGYGGCFNHLTPTFEPRRRVWLEQGGVYAFAHLRGDADLGTDWHRAGMLTRKQNSFDDFLACARHLIEKKYTNPRRLAIEGGSNGGLLMAAALTQAPELFAAVVSYVGAYDMLREELHPSGTHDAVEFGSVKDLEQFKALHAYSPYHRVVDGKQYPAVLLITDWDDRRANPPSTWKMAARLQACGSRRPVLLMTEEGNGHNVGSTRLDGDVFAFLFEQLGIEYRAAER
jgi:prolyl oligopeptidase